MRHPPRLRPERTWREKLSQWATELVAWSGIGLLWVFLTIVVLLVVVASMWPLWLGLVALGRYMGWW